ncbi:MAG: hypothetical protein ACXAD7_14890 [Candidatus Kariarchaeaceae archaeon]|jgi:hypothetical protein
MSDNDQINVHIKDESSSVSSDIGSKPRVIADGEEVNFIPGKSQTLGLKGKTLDVYYYLVQNEGFHGVRDIQRELNLSSSGLTSYHLNRLLKADIITKAPKGKYGIVRNQVRSGSLDDNLRFIKFWIPRTFVFSSLLFMLGLMGTIYLVFNLKAKLYLAFTVISVLLLALILFLDGLKMLNKLDQPKLVDDNNLRNRIKLLQNKLSEALVLKRKNRTKDRLEAQRILETIISEEIIDHELTVFAMFNLCDLLLDELKIYGEEEVLHEAMKLSDRVYKIAMDRNSDTLIIESLLLQHKFDVLSGNLDDAREKLDRALLISDEKKLINITHKINEELITFESSLETLQSLIYDGADLLKRLSNVKVQEHIKNAEIMKLEFDRRN